MYHVEKLYGKSTLTVGDLGLGIRERKAIKRWVGGPWLSDDIPVDLLCTATMPDLLSMKNFGAASLNNVENALAKIGRTLKGRYITPSGKAGFNE